MRCHQWRQCRHSPREISNPPCSSSRPRLGRANETNRPETYTEKAERDERGPRAGGARRWQATVAQEDGARRDRLAHCRGRRSVGHAVGRELEVEVDRGIVIVARDVNEPGDTFEELPVVDAVVIRRNVDTDPVVGRRALRGEHEVGVGEAARVRHRRVQVEQVALAT